MRPRILLVEWTDASSWYWAAILGRTRGPWLAVTVATAQ
jgi:hypothetical protein